MCHGWSRREVNNEITKNLTVEKTIKSYSTISRYNFVPNSIFDSVHTEFNNLYLPKKARFVIFWINISTSVSFTRWRRYNILSSDIVKLLDACQRVDSLLGGRLSPFGCVFRSMLQYLFQNEQLVGSFRLFTTGQIRCSKF